MSRPSLKFSYENPSPLLAHTMKLVRDGSKHNSMSLDKIS